MEQHVITAEPSEPGAQELDGPHRHRGELGAFRRLLNETPS
jgi:hypothetical protein